MRNLYVEISANASAFRGQMVAAGASVREFGHSVSQVAEENAAFRRGLSNTALFLGGAMVAGIAAGVLANEHLQRSMMNVATISTEVRNNIGHYTQEIIDLSTRVPQSAETLANGLYDIVSSGLDGAQAMKVLDVSAKAASAGLTDTATASRAVMSVLNAYGMSASQAGDVSDILFQTVNKGVITFEQLANEIGLVVPTAAAAGVSFGEVGSALATMTLSGLNASEAATSLNQLLTKFLAPSKSMSNALHDLGYQSGAAALRADGLHKVIERLSKSQGTGAETAVELFKDIRAGRGYMALTAAAGHNYAASFDAINSAVARANAAQKAYAIQSQSDAQKWQLIKNQLVAFGMEVASGLMPAFHILTEGIHDFTSMLDAAPGPVKAVLAVLTLLAGSALLLGGSFVRAKAMMSGFALGLQAVGVSAEAAATAVRLSMIAMGAVGIALVAATAIYASYSAEKAKATQVTQDFVQALQQEQSGVAGASLDELVKKMVNDGSLKQINDLGVTTADAVNGIMGSADQFNAVMDRLHMGDPTLDAHLQGLRASYQGYRDDMASARTTVEQLTAAQQAVTDSTAKTATGLQALRMQTLDTKDGVSKLKDEFAPLNKAMVSIADPSQALQASMHNNTSSLDAFMRAMEKQIRAGREWARNLALLAARGRTGMVQQFEALGPQAAGALQDAVHSSNKQLDRLKHDFKVSGQMASGDFTGEVQLGLSMLPTIATNAGNLTVKDLAAAFTNGNISEAMLVLQRLKAQLQGLPVEKKIDIVIATHHTSTGGGGGLGALNPSKPPVNTGNANGGLYVGRVRQFADGGFGSDGRYYDRMSQIVNGGANILWGERETGWEAYISGKATQRERNLRVWAEAGRRLGAEPGGGRFGVERANSGSQTVRHVFEVRVTGELDTRRAMTQLHAAVRGTAESAVSSAAATAGMVGRMNWSGS